MKTSKDFRGKSQSGHSDDLVKRAMKLDPIKKSGKERYAIYGAIEDDDPGDEEMPRKRESVFDYLDDDEEEK